MSDSRSWGRAVGYGAWLVDGGKSAVGELDIAARDELLLEWDKRKKALEAAKEGELNIRKQIAALAFPNPTRGTNTLELGKGYELKLVHKVNYTLSSEAGKVEDVQDAIEKVGNEGKFLADRLIKWKPELSLSEYNKLDTSIDAHKRIKALVDSVLTTKDATPTLEIKEPKDKSAA